MTAAPAFAPSTWNCTLAIPALSEADALTTTVPFTVALFAGAVIETVGVGGGGGPDCGLFTVIFSTTLEAAFPDVSVAIAATVWLPFGAVVVSHAKL